MSTAERLLRAAMPLGGAALRAARHPQLRRVVRLLGDRAEPATSRRHPLAPAAIRVERSRARRGDETSEQTAVTLWFGEGPRLPGAGTGSTALRATARAAVAAIGAAAFGAMSVLAARREQEQLPAAQRARRIKARTVEERSERD